VGSYDEIFRNSNLGNRGMNQVNNASSGILYATPFGELETEHRALGASLSDFTGTVGPLHCGVIASNDFDGKMETKELVGMSVDYCQTLAAALFGGDYNLANMTFFSESDAFFALDNGTIDVLAGGRVRKKSDFASPPLRGFQFSTPYYYGNETARDDVSFFALATREDDAVFSSFVKCVVVATLYAQEKKINREDSERMPSTAIFGHRFHWALRDAIHFSGSYDQLYEKNFGRDSADDRGRNTLNDGGPEIHSFPGLSPQ